MKKLNEQYIECQTLPRGSEGYKRLERVCEIAKSMTKDMRYTVEDVYLDYGQNWVWTTVIATNLKDTRRGDSSFQMLNPREWKEIVNYGDNDSYLYEIVRKKIHEYPSLFNLSTELGESYKKHCQMKESVKDTVSWNVSDKGLLSIYIGDWKVTGLTCCDDMSYERIKNLVDDVLYDMGYNWKEDGTVERINESTKTRFPVKEDFSDDTEILWRKGGISIIKDGYGFGIDNGININRFTVYDDGRVVYDAPEAVRDYVKSAIRSLIRQGKLDNPYYKGKDAKYVGNTLRYGRGIKESKNLS